MKIAPKILGGGALLCLLAAFSPLQDNSGHETHDLIEQLRSSDSDVRNAAGQKLKELGKAARLELGIAARDRDPDVSRWAKLLLRRLDIADHLPSGLQNRYPDLLDHMSLGDDHAWTTALLAASELRPDTGTPVHPWVRREDLEFVALRGVRGAASIEEQENACDAAKHWRLESSTPSLLLLLKSPYVNTRRKAATTLGALRSTPAIPALLGAMNDEDPGVARAAGRALGELGVREAIPGLLKLLPDADRERPRLVLALAKLGAAEAVGEAIKLKGAVHEDNKDIACWILTETENKIVIPELIGLLGCSSEWARHAACMALSRLEAREAIPALMSGLKSPWAKDDAACALGLLGAKEAIPVLLEALKDGTGWGPAQALAALNPGAAGPALVQALEERTLPVDIQTFYAVMGEMGVKEAIRVARKYLKENPWGHYIYDAATYLCRVGEPDGIPFVLEKSGPLFALNALREPGAWALLRSRKLSKYVSGTPRQGVEQLLAGTPLKLVWPKPTSGEEDLWNAQWTTQPKTPQGHVTALSCLEDGENRYEFILERDGIGKRADPRTGNLRYLRRRKVDILRGFSRG